MTADIELGLYPWHEGQPSDAAPRAGRRYTLDFRYQEAGAGVSVRPERSAPVELAAGPPPDADPQAYGERLWGQLFADPAVSEAFAAAQAAALAAGDGSALRVRLYVSPNAPELQSVCWEALCRPDGAPLAVAERTRFSRYLLSNSWRPVRPAPDGPGEMTALLVVAGPEDVEQYRPGGQPLARVDLEAESGRARAALLGEGRLRPENVTELSRGPAGVGRPTLAEVAARLRDGCDFLYLVCHGAVPRGEQSVVWLEDEGGRSDPVAATELAAYFRDLKELPRLVVLASCQSAGDGSAGGGALASLGPLLVAAGVPAVLAMQGNLSMAAAARFMPVFFEELLRDGQIDRAAAAARRDLLDWQRQEGRPVEWWMPVLYLRLTEGGLWGHQPQAPAGAFPHWPALVSSLKRGKCTAVLGSGMLDRFVGPTRRLAELWSERYRFPLSERDRDDLPQVAQFLGVMQAPSFPRDELEETLRQLLRDRFPAAAALPRETPADDLLAAAGAALRAADPDEPHAVLADLPFPVYVTTNGDSLLFDALAAAKTSGRPKVPRAAAFSRTEYPVVLPDRMAADGPAGPPSAERPLVYYLFGHLNDPSSLVLAEDDYFDLLLLAGPRGKEESRRPGEGESPDKIPLSVRGALTDRALVFLGFRLEEWDFRVLVRYINSLGGSERLKNYAQVAVQVDPAQHGRFPNSGDARRYLERHTRFSGQALSIYWGTAEQFLADLRRQYRRG